MGWHVCKKGDRFAALEPVAMGIMGEFGSVERGVARGLMLRMDHGTQHLSDHFQNQVKAWGMTPRFAFLEQPQTNGVVERFMRTLKEQVIYGRAFRNLEEAQAGGRMSHKVVSKEPGAVQYSLIVISRCQTKDNNLGKMQGVKAVPVAWPIASKL